MTEILDTAVEDTETSTGWVNPDGIFGDGVPEKIKNLIEAKKWNSIEQVVEGYTNLEKMTGTGKHLLIPDDDDPEAWAEVYNTLGRPETPDGYEFEEDEEVPLEADLMDMFRQFAHKENYTKKQAASAIAFYQDVVKMAKKADAESKETQKQENIAALKQKWGEANYEGKVKGARAIADKLGIYRTLEAKGLASDPEIISMLDTIASRAAEDVITPSTPAELSKSPLEELEEIKKSPAFTDKFAPGRKELMKRFMELNTIIANMGIGPKRSR